jgi:hypothetical protein
VVIWSIAYLMVNWEASGDGGSQMAYLPYVTCYALGGGDRTACYRCLCRLAAGRQRWKNETSGGKTQVVGEIHPALTHSGVA